MLLLKQSTSVTVQFGPFVDKTDGVALEVGLATAMDNATTGIRLSKNGGTLADRNDSTAPAYDAMGFYKIVLDATDTNTLGTLLMTFEEAATCLPGWMEFMIMPSNVWDSMFGADLLDVNVAQWLGTAAATPTQAGVPEVDITFVSGVAEDLPQTDFNATMKASINTEVDTALVTTTYAEPAKGNPGATISIEEKISWIYKVLRNKKTATSTLITIFNDDTTTPDHQRTISDDGTTFTEEEIVTAP